MTLQAGAHAVLPKQAWIHIGHCCSGDVVLSSGLYWHMWVHTHTHTPHPNKNKSLKSVVIIVLFPQCSLPTIPHQIGWYMTSSCDLITGPSGARKCSHRPSLIHRRLLVPLIIVTVNKQMLSTFSLEIKWLCVGIRNKCATGQARV